MNETLMGSTKTTDCDCPSLEESCIDYIVSLCVIGSAFIISEALPFMRSLEGNSFTDCIVKTLHTSECCLSNLIKCLKGEEDEKEGVEVNTQLTSQQEQQNAININIGNVSTRETEKL
jgi:hypothetical protein